MSLHLVDDVEPLKAEWPCQSDVGQHMGDRKPLNDELRSFGVPTNDDVTAALVERRGQSRTDLRLIVDDQ